jgi:hypothetical protein
MKKNHKAVRIVAVLFLGLLFVPLAKADSVYDFSVGLTNGTTTGTVTGTIDLSFLTPGGSGSGAAASLVLTSFPAGFGVLAGGNTVTAWADQLANQFTVTAGVITSYYFAADTSPLGSADFFQTNNTANTTTDGTWSVLAAEDALDNTSANFGFIFSSTAVTFTPVAATPEPGALTQTTIGVGLLGLIMVMRKRISRDLLQGT